MEARGRRYGAPTLNVAVRGSIQTPPTIRENLHRPPSEGLWSEKGATRHASTAKGGDEWN